MEGTQLIVLREPVAAERTPSGAVRVTEWKEHRARATRIDRGGGVSTQDDLLSNEADAAFIIRSYPSVAKVSQDWTIRDEWADEAWTILSASRVGSSTADQLRVRRISIQARRITGSLEDLLDAVPTGDFDPRDFDPRDFDTGG